VLGGNNRKPISTKKEVINRERTNETETKRKIKKGGSKWGN